MSWLEQLGREAVWRERRQQLTAVSEAGECAGSQEGLAKPFHCRVAEEVLWTGAGAWLVKLQDSSREESLHKEKACL